MKLILFGVVLLFCSSLGFAEPWVIDGYSIYPWCTSIPSPLSIACPPPGSVYGFFMYAGTTGLPGQIYGIDPTGNATLLADGLAAGGQSGTTDGLAFTWGPGFGDQLFATVNRGIHIVTMQPDGSWDFFSRFTPPGYLEGPIEFDPTGLYGSNLFFGWDNGPLYELRPDTSYVAFCQGPYVETVAFGPAGQSCFGTSMYIGNRNPDEIRRVSPDCTYDVVASVQGPVGMVISDGGGLGEFLYVGSFNTGRILRFDCSWAAEDFAGGFVRLFGSDGLAIGPDGALYVTDDLGGTIYRIIATGTPFESSTWGRVKAAYQ